MNKYIDNDFRIFEGLGINLAEYYAHANTAFAEEAAYQTVSAVIENYYRKFNLPDSIVSDYLNKEISFEEGSIITSLRFRNLDINTPFIEVVYSSLPIGADNLDLVTNIILENYHTKSIRFIHFFSPWRMDETTRSGHMPARHKVLYGARLSGTTPMTSPTVDILPATSSHFYDQYVNEYASFQREHPDNKVMSQPESLDYIDSLVKENRVFEIHIRGNFAGIIAYDKKSIFSVPGIEIVEEFLFKTYRGHGEARYAQGLLIDRFLQKQEAPGSLLYGKIHHRNIPSIKTAVYNGRSSLGTWYQVNLYK